MSVSEVHRESRVEIDLSGFRSAAELAELESDGVPGAGFELFPEPRKHVFVEWLAAGVAVAAAGVGFLGWSRISRARKARNQAR